MIIFISSNIIIIIKCVHDIIMINITVIIIIIVVIIMCIVIIVTSISIFLTNSQTQTHYEPQTPTRTPCRVFLFRCDERNTHVSHA